MEFGIAYIDLRARRLFDQVESPCLFGPNY